MWQALKKRKLRRGPRYTTNFDDTQGQNGIPKGKELIIRVKGAEIVTGKLYDHLNGRTYQIDQSHANDEDNDEETTNFTMQSSSHPQASPPYFHLPRGEYTIFTWWWDNDTVRGGTYKDRFLIY